MRAQFLGKDPSLGSRLARRYSPQTAPTERPTSLRAGWSPTRRRSPTSGQSQMGEAIIEIPEDVLKFYQRNQPEEQR